MNINYYCVITLQSFDHLLLDIFYKRLCDISVLLLLRIQGPIKLPLKIRKITVLRSPHIDKKSRDQFECRLHKHIYVVGFSTITSLVLFKFLLKTKIAGLYFKVRTVSCVNSSIG